MISPWGQPWHWRRPDDGRSSDRSFSLVSLNVLADEYCHRKNFEYCRPHEILHWKSRSKALRHILPRLDADILCLQEVDHFDDFWQKELTSLGYRCDYCQRGIDYEDGSRSRSESPKKDGCLVAWRCERFRKVSAEGVNMNLLADVADDSNAIRLRRNNVGQLVILRDLLHQTTTTATMATSTAKEGQGPASGLLLVANCHLFWNPNYEDVKLKQIALLTRCIQAYLSRKEEGDGKTRNTIVAAATPPPPPRRSQEHDESKWEKPVPKLPPDVNLILCGDLNSTPGSYTFRFLADGEYDISAIRRQTDGEAATDSQPTLRLWKQQHATEEGGGDEVKGKGEGQGGNATRGPAAAAQNDRKIRRVLIADAGLDKLARSLRKVGVDAHMFGDEDDDNDNDAKDHSSLVIIVAKAATTSRAQPLRGAGSGKWNSNTCYSLFSLAKRERRLVITQSKKLVQRRDCPPFVLVTEKDHRAAFQVVAKQMQLKFRPELMFQRCTKCNGTFEPLKHESLSQNEKVPKALHAGVDPNTGKKLEFFVCKNGRCRQPYWWAKKTDDEVENYKKMLDAVQKATMRAKDQIPAAYSANSASARALAADARQICTSLIMRHDLKLSSAFPTGSKRSFATNVTPGFTGQIDHVFHSSSLVASNAQQPQSWVDKGVNGKGVVPRAEAGVGADGGGAADNTAGGTSETFLPCESWPSDHLPLRVQFRYRSDVLPDDVQG